MKFPAILRWNKATENWRLLNVTDETHIFELWDCQFARSICDREGITKDKDNLLIIEIRCNKQPSQ